MIVLKSLLPFLAIVDERKIFCFYDQEDGKIHTIEDVSVDVKNEILKQIQDDISISQQNVKTIDYSEAQQISEEFNKMKDEYDSGKYEFPDIKL